MAIITAIVNPSHIVPKISPIKYPKREIIIKNPITKNIEFLLLPDT